MGVKWTTQKPDEFFQDKKNELHKKVIPRIAKDMAEALKNEIKRRTPHGVRWSPPGAPFAVATQTSTLHDSIDKERRGKWSTGHYRWVVSTDIEYAPYVEYGTKPHLIRPHNPDDSLVYYTKGNQTGSKVVHHPGTRPVLMFSRSVPAMRSRVRYIASPHLNKWAHTR